MAEQPDDSERSCRTSRSIFSPATGPRSPLGHDPRQQHMAKRELDRNAFLPASPTEDVRLPHLPYRPRRLRAGLHPRPMFA